jgi:hypothetical protein
MYPYDYKTKECKCVFNCLCQISQEVANSFLNDAMGQSSRWNMVDSGVTALYEDDATNIICLYYVCYSYFLVKASVKDLIDHVKDVPRIHDGLKKYG